MNTLLFTHFFGGIFALLLGLYIAPMVISIAHKFGIIDRPDGNLKQHRQPTPYLGGLVVYISFVTTLALVYPLEKKILWLVLGCTQLLFLGLIDDLIGLLPRQKIAGHALAALCFLQGGLWLRHAFFASYIALPLSFLWMLTVINAFNLVDVMDGLSSTLALTSAVGFASVALLAGQYDVSLLMVIFAGAISAFLYFNRQPAQIYLGDCGSLFVGGFFAAAPLLISWSSIHTFGSLVPPVLLALPLAEVVTLMVVRTYKNIPFYRGSPHHFAHYLQAKGWTVSQILLLCLVVSAGALGVTHLFLHHYIAVVYWLALLVAGFLFWLFIIMR